MKLIEKAGLYMKSKSLPLIAKYICLTMLSVNSVNKFSEMYLSYSLNFTTNNSYFRKMALAVFQYKPMSLDVNKFCFDKKQGILIHVKNQEREWCRCGKCGVMDKNVEWLSCSEVEALRYF